VVFTGTGSIDIIFQFLVMYIFGSPEVVGLFLLTLLFVFLTMVRVNFVIGLVLTLPLNIVLLANGSLYPLVAGIHVLIVFFILGLSFLRQK